MRAQGFEPWTYGLKDVVVGGEQVASWLWAVLSLLGGNRMMFWWGRSVRTNTSSTVKVAD
ncbi:hypothetical protein MalM14_32670 [Gimesia chilikensis]|nr:hypothetical protein MalM14_32670 [Gimesia chilikensis]